MCSWIMERLATKDPRKRREARKKHKQLQGELSRHHKAFWLTRNMIYIYPFLPSYTLEGYTLIAITDILNLVLVLMVVLI